MDLGYIGAKIFCIGRINSAIARRMQILLNQKIWEENQINMKSNNGWLKLLKKRKFKSFKRHGEIGDTDEDLISIELPKLQEKLKNYHRRDVFNADEF